MSKCVIVGRPRVGKTTFCRNFCAFLGKKWLAGAETCDVRLPVRKGAAHLTIADTASLVPGVHPDPAQRRSVAETLQALHSAEIVLQVVSAVSVERGFEEELDGVDLLVHRYASKRKKYIVLCNKMDLPGAPRGFDILCRLVGASCVIPICALNGTGFRKVAERLASLL